MANSSSSSQSRSKMITTSSSSRATNNSPTSVGNNPPPMGINNVGGSPTNSATLGLGNTLLNFVTGGKKSSSSIASSSNITIPTIATTTTTKPIYPPVSTTTIAPTQGQQGSGRNSGGARGNSSGEGRTRKRGRATTAGGGDKKGRVELNAPKNIDPTCPVCGRKFASSKAYYGHLRSHSDRGWRGAFPPTTTLRPEVGFMAPTLLKSTAEETVASSNMNITASKPQQGHGPFSSASRPVGHVAGTSAAFTPSKYMLDLNELPPPEDDINDEADVHRTSSNMNITASNPQEGHGPFSSASRPVGHVAGTTSTPSKYRFDLNKLPPPEDDIIDEADAHRGQEKKKDDKGKGVSI